MIRSICCGAAAVALSLAGFNAWAAQPANGGLAPGIPPYVPPVTAAARISPAQSPSPVNGSANSSPVPTTPQGAPTLPLASTAGATPGALATGSDPASLGYVLGPADKLRIIVFGEPDLTGEFTVAGNGELSFPLIGQLAAGGKSVGELRNEIEVALRQGYLKDPRVSAEVLTFRPYFILGEVAKPGVYPYSAGITVLNAIATSGGFTYRANRKTVFIKKPGEPKEQKVRLTGDLAIAPGETIRVAESLF